MLVMYGMVLVATILAVTVAARKDAHLIKAGINRDNK